MDTPDVLVHTLREALEAELRREINAYHVAPYELYYEMLAYHMGWMGEGAGAKATGKRIRPLILLLCTAASGGDWQKALPAAAAVEFVHNFSLVHDDIEDRSEYRRGRPTIWAKWGIPQGINAGDALFTISHLTIHRLAEFFSPDLVLQAAQILLQTCLQLTQGQFLDISYESRAEISLEEYQVMIEGKTAALFAACAHLGSLIANCDPVRQHHFREFGRALGLAFQIIDDLLGIWGDEATIGKSTSSDLLSGKKTYPVILGLQSNGAFAKRWRKGKIQPEEVLTLAQELEEEGIRAATQAEATRLTQLALAELSAAQPSGPAAEALSSLTRQMSQRVL
ncbi:MAG: polyprenyl synthetase family protein [Anaerolineales bacterium]|nr:polyprenyl synthetase family protein [Anaerolineales bacterium]MDW8446047.1 polyprenyl synthetase family protein [Anaerolineales bacterium]